MAKEEKQTEEILNKEKKSSSMKLPIMIGFIAGILIINAGIIYLLFTLLISPTLTTQDTSDSENSQTEIQQENTFETEFDESHKPIFKETGRITTNPKNSDRFVVVNLGIEFKSKEKLEELEPALLAKIRGTINSTFANMTIDEIHSQRDSLNIIFQNNLKPIFQKEKKLISEVIIQEFIIQ